MIPIRDSIKSKHFPKVNLALIIASVLVFLYELALDQYGLQQFVMKYGAIPDRIISAGGRLDTILPLFTAMFIHGGWLHLLGNMLFLWIFGDNVEDRLGSVRYLLFYLATGLAGFMAQMAASPVSSSPMIGASGAIAGVMGAYILMFPRSKIIALVPIFFFFTFIEVPAFLFLILWFGLQLLNGVAGIGTQGNLVAWWAHVGGFLTGLVGAVMMRSGMVRAK